MYINTHCRRLCKTTKIFVIYIKFRKLLTNGRSNRETRRINFRKAYFEIHQRQEACIEKMPTKNKLSSYKLERICFNCSKIIKK